MTQPFELYAMADQLRDLQELIEALVHKAERREIGLADLNAALVPVKQQLLALLERDRERGNLSDEERRRSEKMMRWCLGIKET